MFNSVIYNYIMITRDLFWRIKCHIFSPIDVSLRQWARPTPRFVFLLSAYGVCKHLHGEILLAEKV